MSKIILYDADVLVSAFFKDLTLGLGKKTEYGDTTTQAHRAVAVFENTENNKLDKSYSMQVTAETVNIETGRERYRIDITNDNTIEKLCKFSMFDIDSLTQAVEDAQLDIVKDIRQKERNEKNFASITLENLEEAIVNAISNREITIEIPDDVHRTVYFKGEAIFSEFVKNYFCSYSEIAKKIALIFLTEDSAKEHSIKPELRNTLFNTIEPYRYTTKE